MGSPSPVLAMPRSQARHSLSHIPRGGVLLEHRCRRVSFLAELRMSLLEILCLIGLWKKNRK